MTLPISCLHWLPTITFATNEGSIKLNICRTHPCHIQVQIGENAIVGPSPDRQIITVKKIITHPAYRKCIF